MITKMIFEALLIFSHLFITILYSISAGTDFFDIKKSHINITDVHEGLAMLHATITYVISLLFIYNYGFNTYIYVPLTIVYIFVLVNIRLYHKGENKKENNTSK